MSRLPAILTKSAVAIAVALAVLVLSAPAAHAQDSAVRVETKTILDGLGFGGTALLSLALASLVCTVVAMFRVRRSNGWPHWAGLVGGLGDAAFLVGVVTGLMRLYWGLREVADLGVATTFADVAGPVSESLGAIILGALASLLALGLRGLVRVRESRRHPT
ncbi:MAG: hypothetical protein ACYTG3_03105 [Planctomycetota bacterium]|jgi:hypothetical protein